MKKKTIGIGILIGVLLIGIVSASLLTYFGRITGNVEVTGPFFYLDGQIDEGVYHKLLINEKPENEEEVTWTNGETIKFKTDALGVDYFYDAEFNFIFYAKANATDNRIQMRITKLNDDSSQGEEICISGSKNITATQRYSNYELSCSSRDIINLEKEHGFVLEVFSLSENVTDEYWLSTGDPETGEREYGASRIEVSTT